MNSIKKYEIAGRVHGVKSGRVFYRIRATRDIPKYGVRAGDLGGLVERPRNLSQYGDCWIDYTSKAIGYSRVCDNSFICDHSVIKNNAVVRGESMIRNNITIDGNADVRNFNINGAFFVGFDKFKKSMRLQKLKREFFNYATIIVSSVAITFAFCIMMIVLSQ